jgi:nitroimidazol reductase NimA-like FMN-containing flavoprotein (pyridoxamine 5'-phosphate oxidase superfamily)
MTVDPFDQWLGTPMSDAAVDDLLDTAGWGILSLADDGEPYSIPISFGYTGDVVYFALTRESPSDAKFEYITEGQTARLVVTDIQSRMDWRSVAVTGPLFGIGRGDDDWVEMLDVMEDNAWFSSDYRQAGKSVGLQAWRLEPDDVSGVGL